MSWRQFLFLGLLGLAVAAAVAVFQPAPGYMDADYYAVGGAQLATGRGFSEPFLWNYLDDPSGLPHPSNAYWMPLASLLAAAGAWLLHSTTWSALRLGSLIVAACIPPLTASLAYAWTSRRDLALVSGLLAVFSAFYLPFLSTTDTFGLYMLLGGLFFLALGLRSWWLRAIVLGLLAGLMHLARADGLFWLGMAILAVLFVRREKRTATALAGAALLCLAGYLAVMGPWLARNEAVFGTLLAPGGARSLWLTQYDQLFSYPTLNLDFSTWWASGLSAVLKARLWALGMNLANTFAVQAEVLLLPLIAAGAWALRRERSVQLALLGWALTLGAMTVVFPFAGARGGYLHSGAALQTAWWALAPLGLDRLLEWAAQRRAWDGRQAGKVFQAALVGMVVLVSALVVYQRVIGRVNGDPVWGRENAAYRTIGQYLAAQGASPQAMVIVANPPGFYLASGHPAIAVPYGGADVVLQLARRYGASYLVLEKSGIPAGLQPVYLHPDGQAGLRYLGEVEEARVYAIQP